MTQNMGGKNRGWRTEGEGHPGEIRFTRHLREFHWVKKIRGLEAKKLGIEEYPAQYYQELLEYIKDRYEGQRPRWNPLIGFCKADFHGVNM